MTPEETQALRDFLAEKVMGWHIEPSMSRIPCYYDREHDFMEMASKWHPDQDSSQRDLLIDKMVEDGWWIEFTGPYNSNYYCEFKISGRQRNTGANNPDRRIAVCLAIKEVIKT